MVFMAYMLWKFYSRKKIGKQAKTASWVMGTLMMLIGLGGLLISFLIFYTPSVPIIWRIIFPIFSLAFVISGILMILVAEGKIKSKM